MYACKTQVHQIRMQIQEMMHTIKNVKTIGSSAKITKSCNTLIDQKSVSQTVQKMMREMAKAQVISELADDAFDVMADPDDDLLADQEVDEIVSSMILGKVVNVLPSNIPEKEKEGAEEEREAEDKEDLTKMQERLAKITAT